MEHKLSGGVRVDHEENVDDVLVQRIMRLRNELEEERKAHRSDVEELKERLDTAIEVNAKLRRYNELAESRSMDIADRHVDILASLMALYPFTPDKDLVLEFNLPVERIREVARVLGAVKSTEARRDAVEYLRKQHIKMVERRGGDQGNHHPVCKQVEKVSVDGMVMETYRSVKDAADANKITDKTVRKYCKAKLYTKEGYTFKYKKLEDNEREIAND